MFDPSAPTGPSRFEASCASLASMLRLQMTFGVIAILNALQTRTPHGELTFQFTPAVALLGAFLAVIALAWFMVKKCVGIPVWAPIVVVLAAVSLLGRLQFAFGDHEGVPTFALIFMVLGVAVDIGVGWLAVSAFTAWRAARRGTS